KVKQLNIYRLDEFPKLLKEGERRIRSKYGNNTGIEVCQSDIKQMFTYLDHTHLRKAIEWMIGKSIQISAKKTRRKPYIVISTTKDENGKYVIEWSTAKGNCGRRT